MENNRNVFQKLDDIKKAIEEINDKDSQRKVTISEMVGVPFEEYMNTSTLYFYEPDERKFQKQRKKEIKASVILLSIYLIFVIFHIILMILRNDIDLLLCLVDGLLLILPVLKLIYGITQKSKKTAKSKWNRINFEFYSCEGKLAHNIETGIIQKVFTICRIIAILSIPILSIWLIINSKQRFLEVLSLFALLPLSSRLNLMFYNYPMYIFDKKESYIITDLEEWKRIEKIRNFLVSKKS